MPVGVGWDVPSNVRDRVEFHWFHVPVSGALVLGVLSGEPIWYVGHFDGKRMRECTGTGCELCARGMGTQLRFVICAVDMSTRQVGVLEFGPSVARVLGDWIRGLGYSKGLIIEVARATKSKHSRMEVSLIKEPPAPWVMATPSLDLEEVLKRTWDRLGGGE